MIRFPCQCGHPFSLDDTQAGGLIQCPVCGRLNDVPTLDELLALARDGTYALRDAEQPKEPDRLADLSLFFGPKRVDSAGREKDLRPTRQDVRAAGVDPVDRDRQNRPRALPPRYDPETGQRVRSLEIARSPDPLPHQIPVAKAALTYATGDAARGYNPLGIVLDLCSAPNLFVMFFIFVFHFVAQVITFAILCRIYFVAGPLAIIAFLLLAHYGNVIDDTGPEARDELPRPLRFAGFRDDMWLPFVRVIVALAFCYWPVLLAMNLNWAQPIRNAFAGLLAIAGSVFIPAALLTATTSGTLSNLRPDRVVGVINQCGGRYILAILSWFVAVGVYAVGYNLSNRILLGWLAGVPQVRGFAAVGYTLLALGIFLMHFFCWQLGLLYRARHDEFPWVFQRHVRSRKED